MGVFSVIAGDLPVTEVFAIRVFMDGDKWCALVGAECCGGNLSPANLLLNLQHGVSGWGDTKEAAIADLARVMQKLKDAPK